MSVDPVAIKEELENLERGGQQWAASALERIVQLERLCGMMTDTGVILEEDVADLLRPDVWWVPGDGECCYDSLEKAMEGSDFGIDYLDVCQWSRSHYLADSFAVKFPEIRDENDRPVVPERVEEYLSYEEAEAAVAEHQIRARRARARAQ